jgi:hypothetical protein
MGVVSQLKLVQVRLGVLTSILYGIMSVPMQYYFITRLIRFTYFGSAATYGILTSERFASLEFWIALLTVSAWFPVLWVGSYMLAQWKSRAYKIAFLVYLSITLAFFTSVFVIHWTWLTGKNNPAFPDDPASSYRRCCVPEFYNVVPTCPNYGSLTPECNPPINLSELGSNGDFWVGFGCNTSLMILWALYIYFTVEFMRLVDRYQAQLEKGKKTPPTDEAATTTTTTTVVYPSASSAPVLLDVESTKKLIQSRTGAARPPPFATRTN